MINPFKDNPSNDGQVLSSDTNGNLSWITPSAPTPAAGTISYIGSYTYTPELPTSYIFNTALNLFINNGQYLILTLNTTMDGKVSSQGHASLILTIDNITNTFSNKFYVDISRLNNINLTFVVPITSPFTFPITLINIIISSDQLNAAPTSGYNTTLILTKVN